jgi:hypothetical protein
MEVWIVERGVKYEESWVDGVFDSEEKALKYMDEMELHPGEYGELDSYEVK